jgi:hypothetical protein
MTEQHRTHPVPGPPPGEHQQPAEQRTGEPAGHPFADLEQRPVTEHVAVFEAEHARLQEQLSSIDQL